MHRRFCSSYSIDGNDEDDGREKAKYGANDMDCEGSLVGEYRAKDQSRGAERHETPHESNLELEMKKKKKCKYSHNHHYIIIGVIVLESEFCGGKLVSQSIRQTRGSGWHWQTW
jgi:hypothetical protein